MKIGIFDPYLDTMSGGEKYMLSAALCLSKEHEVTIFWKETEKEEIVKRAKKRFDMDLEKFSFVDPIFTKKTPFLTKISRSKDYDGIFLLSDGSIPFVSSKLFIHFQSPMEWVSASSPITKFKLKRVNKFICNSEFTKSYIDKRFNISSSVIYPPVTIQKLYNESKKKNKILHVGRFGITGSGSSYKRQDVLAEVFSKIHKKGLKNWKLIFVMSVMKSDEERAQEFQDKYKNSQIEFIINPTNEELWNEYEEAKIYWHASGFGEDLSLNPDRAEHFGISTVEAMGAGAVPIVFYTGGQKEIVKDEENGFAWQTEEELVKITSDLIQSDDKRKKIALKAKESAKTFSGQVFEEQILALFS